MKYLTTLGSAIVLLGLFPLSVSGEGYNNPREARRAVRAAKNAGKTLTDAINMAEEKTGGMAVSARLLSADMVRHTYDRFERSMNGHNHSRRIDGDQAETGRAQEGRSENARSRNAGDSDAHAKDQNQRQKSGEQQKGEKSQQENARQSKSAKQGSQDDDAQGRQSGNRYKTGLSKHREHCHVQVSCLVDGAKLRTVLIDLEDGKVLGMQNGSFIGQDNDFDEERINRPDRYGRNTDRYDDADRSYFHREDRYVEHDAYEHERHADDRSHRQSRTRRYSNNDSRADRGHRNTQRRADRDSYESDGWNATNGDDDRHARNHNSLNRPGRMVLGSDLLNTQIQNYENDAIGDIDDLAIDPQTGEVVYAALGRGGFLGLGRSYYAIPAGELKSFHNGVMIMDVRANEFDHNDGFDYENWPQQANTAWSSDWNDAKKVKAKKATTVAKASAIMGRSLKSRNGESIGEIQDIVVDMKAKKVAYLLVYCDEGLVAIPASAVTHQSENCVIDMTRQRIARMPSFSYNEYPNWNSVRWNRRTHSMFDVDPYWEASSDS